MRPHRMLAVVLPLLLMLVAQRGVAQPTADEALALTEFSDAEKQSILAGEMVIQDLKEVSDRDLSLGMGFIVKSSPDKLAQQVMSGAVSKADAQIQARGVIGGAGRLEDFAGLHLTPGGSDMARAYINVKAGSDLNLTAAEISGFNGLKDQADPVKTVEQQLRTMLLARYQAYRASGLAGIAPYVRDGKSSDAAADLAAASAAPLLKKFFPSVQKMLVGYPQATVPGVIEHFAWANYKLDDKPNFVLGHVFSAAEGDARVVVQRQYYVGRGYNAEQAVAVFFPVAQGTLVIYGNHTFTDQVSGFGGSTKRSIGRRMMGSTLKQLFEKARASATSH